MNYSMLVKNKLMEKIRDMQSDSRHYVNDPQRDFTRNRKLSFSQIMEIIISMEGMSVER